MISFLGLLQVSGVVLSFLSVNLKKREEKYNILSVLQRILDSSVTQQEIKASSTNCGNLVWKTIGKIKEVFQMLEVSLKTPGRQKSKQEEQEDFILSLVGSCFFCRDPQSWGKNQKTTKIQKRKWQIINSKAQLFSFMFAIQSKYFMPILGLETFIYTVAEAAAS